MYIGTRQPVKLHDQLRVSFFLPAVSSERIDLNARVAWINQGFPRSSMSLAQGFGVEYRAIPANLAAIIGDFIRRFSDN